MRVISAGLFALALAAASPAFAVEAGGGALRLSHEAQRAFHETYGDREAEALGAYLDRQIAKALSARGVSPSALHMQATLISAAPDHPTLKQTADNVTMDWARSRSLGGAGLKATLMNARGQTVDVNFTWYRPDLSYAPALNTWSSAEEAIRTFAGRVAAAYVGQD